MAVPIIRRTFAAVITLRVQHDAATSPRFFITYPYAQQYVAFVLN